MKRNDIEKTNILEELNKKEFIKLYSKESVSQKPLKASKNDEK